MSKLSVWFFIHKKCWINSQLRLFANALPAPSCRKIHSEKDFLKSQLALKTLLNHRDSSIITYLAHLLLNYSGRNTFFTKKSLQEAVVSRQSRILFRPFHSSHLGSISFVTLTLAFSLFVALAQSAEVTLAWDQDPEPALLGYKVYYKTGTSDEP